LEWLIPIQTNPVRRDDDLVDADFGQEGRLDIAPDKRRNAKAMGAHLGLSRQDIRDVLAYIATLASWQANATNAYEGGVAPEVEIHSRIFMLWLTPDWRTKAQLLPARERFFVR